MSGRTPNAFNEYGALRTVAVKHPRAAFLDQATLDAQWVPHGFTARPEFTLACHQYDAFLEALAAHGTEFVHLPADDTTTIDSIYARDASVVAPPGVVLASMGKELRRPETGAHGRAYAAIGAPWSAIAGRIELPGRLEGGDVVWFDAATVAVGRGYRTNAEGIQQLREHLGRAVDLIEVPLPHWRGPGDVMHLMSLVSPVDAELVVVYSPLLPVLFREWLVTRGMTLVETPDEEFASMGTNVLALGPRHCLMLEGNPRTRAALERAGAEVVEYDGSEISVKGGGGPTCLTRPLLREA
jgi:N-dimethylarginine dimethylaminohydrolase